jgi:hypothetical protein
MALSAVPASSGHPQHYTFGITSLDRVNEELLREYWDELEQRVNLPQRLKEMIQQRDPQGSYTHSFQVLAERLRSECAIPLPNGVVPIVRAHFNWIQRQIAEQDRSLVILYDTIEAQIPAGRRARHLIIDSPEKKMQKIREWFADEQFDADRRLIKTLILSGCGLKVFPPEIGALRGLTRLYLDDNAISSIPPQMSGLTHLRELGMNDNQLTTLPSGLNRLEVLLLRDNQIRVIPTEIDQMKRLIVLDLGNNQIAAIPHQMKHLQQLKMVLLDSNQIKDIPNEIFELSRLESLSLAVNKITSISPQIQKLTSLKSLYLGYNEITRIPKEIAHLPHLEKLCLEKNPVSVIESGIWKLSNAAIKKNPQLMLFRREAEHLCASPLAQLYLDMMLDRSDQKVTDHFSQLPVAVQKQLMQMTDQAASSSSASSSSSSQPYCWDDREQFRLNLRAFLLQQWEQLPQTRKIEGMQRLCAMAGLPMTDDPMVVQERIESHLPRLAEILASIPAVDKEVFSALPPSQKLEVLHPLSILHQIILLKECLNPDGDIPDLFRDVLTMDLFTDPVRDQCGGDGHVFERSAILQHCSKDTIKDSEIEIVRTDAPALCPLNRQALNVQRIFQSQSDLPNQDNWTYERTFYVKAIPNKKGEGLVPDLDLQNEILHWLKTQLIPTTEPQVAELAEEDFVEIENHPANLNEVELSRGCTIA